MGKPQTPPTELPARAMECPDGAIEHGPPDGYGRCPWCGNKVASARPRPPFGAFPCPVCGFGTAATGPCTCREDGALPFGDDDGTVEYR